MTKAELKKVTGFDTWLELYQLLKQDGHDQHETVKISPPIHRQNTDKPEEWTLRVNDIKAWSFDEIYPRLPLAKSVHVVQELLGTLNITCISRGHEIEQVYTFLNNLLTRKP